MKRAILMTVLIIAVIGALAPFLSANRFRDNIQNGLEQALGRKVIIPEGTVHFNLFTGPGFKVERVTIEDDPSAGIEPFAYVESLDARIRFLSLLRGRVEFSSLRLVNPKINLVKNQAGVWNFQLFLNRRANPLSGFPALYVRGDPGISRISFKFGSAKSVFYFDAPDLDVSPQENGTVDVRFAGSPARTDRAAQSFGQLTARGNWQPVIRPDSQLNLSVTLERSAISEVFQMLDGHGIGVHGIVASHARITGPLSNLQVTGQLQVDDIHRWDLMPPKGGGWLLNYRGQVDLWTQKLELETVAAENPKLPVAIRYQAGDYLTTPHWNLSVELQKLPVATFLQVARHMGAPLPEGVQLDGTLSGVIGYNSPGGMEGKILVEDSSVQLPDASPVKLASAELAAGENTVTFGPATVDFGKDQTAEIQGSYLVTNGDFDIKITTSGLKVAELQSGSGRLLGAASVPILEACRQGTWKGWVRYLHPGSGIGAWTGQAGLENVQLDLPGVADPLRLASAALAIDGPRVAVTKLQGTIGDIAFGGDYRYDPGAQRPHKLRLAIPEADLAEVERLLKPTLVRQHGLLARLRLSRAPLPDWLKTRKLDATLRVDSLTAGETEWKLNATRMLWDGAEVRLANVDARLGDLIATGRITADLSGALPRYNLAGKVQGLAYRGGKLDIDGKLDTQGTGLQLVANARADGTFQGRSITLSAEADFRTIAGSFEFAVASGAPRWRLTAIQAAQGADNFTGEGSSQPDGRVLLELASGRRQVRYSGNLFAVQPP